MLPPPALTVSISTAGKASGMPPTAPAPSASGAPPTTRLASALVPPMSSVSRSGWPTAAPTRRAPTTPPAGPESANDAACAAAPAGARVPPLEVITRRALIPRPRGGDAAHYPPLRERREHPGRPHALRGAHHVVPGHERRRVVAPQVVQRRAVLTPQPEQVLEPTGRDEHHAGAAAFEQRVGRDRGAVDQELDGR